MAESNRVRETVFRELCDPIVLHLPLFMVPISERYIRMALLAPTHLRRVEMQQRELYATQPLMAVKLISRDFHVAAIARIAELRVRALPLMHAPFNLGKFLIPVLWKLDRFVATNHQLGNDSITAFARACTAGAFCGLLLLDLSGCCVGDSGCTALADAIHGGGLCKLQQLDLRDGRSNSGGVAAKGIGDEGIVALARACKAGMLRALKDLHLGLNDIGNLGCTALASACCGLPRLETLGLAGNRIGDDGIAALGAAAADHGWLAALKVFRIWGNEIGDLGLCAFATACAKGSSLPNLEVLWLQNRFGGHVFTNRFGDEGVRMLAVAVESGALPSLTELELILEAGGTRETIHAACEVRGIHYPLGDEDDEEVEDEEDEDEEDEGEF